MKLILILAVIASYRRDLLVSADPPPEEIFLTNDSAKKLLDELVADAGPLCKASSQAGFNYYTDITPEHKKAADEAGKAENALWNKYRARVAKANWTLVTDKDISRQLDIVYEVGVDALNEKEKAEIFNCVTKWIENWGTTTIPKDAKNPKSEQLLLSEIEKILADPDAKAEEKLYVCSEWKSQVGQKGKDCFPKYVELANKAAKENSYKDYGEYMRSIYEIDNFVDEIDKAWEKVRPLYDDLYAYVRCKLNKKYGDETVSLTKPLPCCLLGNIHAQDWSNIYQFTAPYPDVPLPSLKDLKGYTVEKMYRDGDEFLKGLGLIPLPDSFYEKSMLVKPENKSVICQGMSWDLCDQHDFRISRCTTLTSTDYNNAIELLGITQYAMQYNQKQPFMYQDAANPAFYNTIGRLFGLAMNRPDPKWDEKTVTNYLYHMALDRIAFLPFSVLVDKWRWGVFSGDIKEADYNTEWWNLIRKYQGCVSTVPAAKDSIDALSKYHVAANYGYIRYFMADILQYQIFERLCNAAGHKGPLFQCDISSSKDAGQILSKAMKLGSSTPWPEVLEILTGSKKLDPAAMIKFFEGLTKYLKKDNQEKNCKAEW